MLCHRNQSNYFPLQSWRVYYAAFIHWAPNVPSACYVRIAREFHLGRELS